MKRAIYVMMSVLFLMGADSGGCGGIQIPDCFLVTPQNGGTPVKVCNADDTSNTCTCQFGCNADGSCKSQSCSASCTLGCNSDGTCRTNNNCSASCTLGCNVDGTCKSSSTADLISLSPTSITVRAGNTGSFSVTARATVSKITTSSSAISCLPDNLTANGTSICSVYTSSTSVVGIHPVTVTAQSPSGSTDTETETITVYAGTLPDGSGCSFNNECSSGQCLSGFCRAQSTCDPTMLTPTVVTGSTQIPECWGSTGQLAAIGNHCPAAATSFTFPAGTSCTYTGNSNGSCQVRQCIIMNSGNGAVGGPK